MNSAKSAGDQQIKSETKKQRLKTGPKQWQKGDWCWQKSKTISSDNRKTNFRTDTQSTLFPTVCPTSEPNKTIFHHKNHTPTKNTIPPIKNQSHKRQLTAKTTNTTTNL
ncbi:MAG: hypothetical protein U5N85_05610 [Arcicella sp.]|nr:hypothetical protein [Arcicella sp.]